MIKYLKSQKGGLLSRDIKWNFTKFLVGRNGRVVARFEPTDDMAKLDAAIAELCNKK